MKRERRDQSQRTRERTDAKEKRDEGKADTHLHATLCAGGLHAARRVHRVPEQAVPRHAAAHHPGANVAGVHAGTDVARLVVRHDDLPSDLDRRSAKFHRGSHGIVLVRRPARQEAVRDGGAF